MCGCQLYCALAELCAAEVAQVMNCILASTVALSADLVAATIIASSGAGWACDYGGWLGLVGTLAEQTNRSLEGAEPSTLRLSCIQQAQFQCLHRAQDVTSCRAG